MSNIKAYLISPPGLGLSCLIFFFLSLASSVVYIIWISPVWYVVSETLGSTLCKVTNIVLFSFFTYRMPVRPAPFIEDAFFFPLDSFDFFVKDQVSTNVWVYFWVNYIVLIDLSVSVPIPCSFCQYCSVCSTAWYHGW